MFFFIHALYRMAFSDGKIHAKKPKTIKKETSTHVFGNFNAQKAESLIAPQHIKMFICTH